MYALFTLHDDPNTNPSAYSAMMALNDVKALQYSGFNFLSRGEDVFELYDLSRDPDELENLEPIFWAQANEYKRALQQRLIQGFSQ